MLVYANLVAICQSLSGRRLVVGPVQGSPDVNCRPRPIARASGAPSDCSSPWSSSFPPLLRPSPFRTTRSNPPVPTRRSTPSAPVSIRNSMIPIERSSRTFRGERAAMDSIPGRKTERRPEHLVGDRPTVPPRMPLEGTHSSSRFTRGNDSRHRTVSISRRV